MYLPIVVSSAPLSALLALVRLGALAAGSIPAPGLVLNILEPVDVFVLLFGMPVVCRLCSCWLRAPRTRMKDASVCGDGSLPLPGWGMAIVLDDGRGSQWQWLNDTGLVKSSVVLDGGGLVYAGAHVLCGSVLSEEQHKERLRRQSRFQRLRLILPGL
jgi:hypothetical protein